MHPPAGRRSETRPPLPREGDPTVRLDTGDARTLAALYDRHAGAVYSLAMRITGEPADAEAIVRGVFAAAWTEAGRHPGRQAPDAHWLLSTARIRAIDHVRAGATPDAAAPTAAGASWHGTAPADGAAAETQVGDVATLHVPDPARGRVADGTLAAEAPRLRAVFRGLPALERLAIELAYFEGLTISQIAARLEQAPDAANKRIRTGLARLAGLAAEGQRTSEPRHDMPPTRDLAALYALGALNASERAAFDAHIEVHRESVDEVLSLLTVTRRLASVAPPHEPPAGLRERVVETVTGAPLPNVVEQGAPESAQPADADPSAEPVDVAGSQQPLGPPESVVAGGGSGPENDNGALEPAVSHDESEQFDAAGGSEPVADGDSSESVADGNTSAHADSAGKRPPGKRAAPSAPTAPVREPTPPAPTPPEQEPPPAMPEPTPTVQKKGGRWGLPSLAAGSLVVAAGLGWFAARQADLATALQENLDAANTQARMAELETAAAQRVADGLRGGARVLTATDVQPLDLDGQPVAPDARGRLFWSASEGGLLTATGLPPVPPGRVYQLWLIPDASPQSAAVLSADAEGRVMAVVTPPEGVTGPVPAAVTLEPTGGATTPGGDVYLLGRP